MRVPYKHRNEVPTGLGPYKFKGIGSSVHHSQETKTKERYINTPIFRHVSLVMPQQRGEHLVRGPVIMDTLNILYK